jgi:hypothetical protein
MSSAPSVKKIAYEHQGKSYRLRIVQHVLDIRQNPIVHKHIEDFPTIECGIFPKSHKIRSVPSSIDHSIDQYQA